MTIVKEASSVVLTYVWVVQGAQQSFRSKIKTVNQLPKSAEELPNILIEEDGTGEGYHLLPVRLYQDPLLLELSENINSNYLLVLCETVTASSDHQQLPTSSNTRRACKEAMDSLEASVDPWFGIEQEYFMMDAGTGRPIGWPCGGMLPNTESVHCFTVGADRVVGRALADLHYAACLYAGVKIDGTNAEGGLGQWEYQVGPCPGISIGDDLLLSRYLLIRLAERFNVVINFAPKPIQGVRFCSGAHVNFSTSATRATFEGSGMKAIEKAVERLSKSHAKHLAGYDPSGGKDNEARLTGNPVCATWTEFTSGIGDRAASVRIPAQTASSGGGYLEDRRPSANCDPYRVAELLVRTICLEKN